MIWTDGKILVTLSSPPKVNFSFQDTKRVNKNDSFVGKKDKVYGIHRRGRVGCKDPVYQDLTS